MLGLSSDGLLIERSLTVALPCAEMFAILAADENTINTWAEPRSAEGVTANTVIDSNDSPPGASLTQDPQTRRLPCVLAHSQIANCSKLSHSFPGNNQQRMEIRGY